MTQHTQKVRGNQIIAFFRYILTFAPLGREAEMIPGSHKGAIFAATKHTFVSGTAYRAF